jgi:hypothetical protein
MQLGRCLVLSLCATVVLCLSASANAADANTGVIRIDSRQFQMPVFIEQTVRSGIKELQLFASTDGGKTWELVASGTADTKSFRFEAPRNATYWFKTRVVMPDGNVSPRDLSSAETALKVQVEAAELEAEKTTAQTIQELKTELKVLREKMKQIQQRLAKIEKAKAK